jgi:hypothetical protein
MTDVLVMILKNLRAAVATMTKRETLANMTNDAIVDVALISNVFVAIEATRIDKLHKIKPTTMSPGPYPPHKTISIAVLIISPRTDVIGSAMFFSCDIRSNLHRASSVYI